MTSGRPAGPTVPAIDAVLDAAFAATRVTRRIAFGPSDCLMGFEGAAQAEAYCSALLPAPPTREPAAFSAALLHGNPGPLAPFMPRDATAFAFRSDGRVSVAWMPEPWPSLSLFDHATQRGVQWTPERTIRAEFRARPGLFLLHAHFSTTAWVPLHAGAVGHDGRFLLLCGPSRSGKTTAALACAGQGWAYAGDDIVLAHPAHGCVAPLFLSARLRPPCEAALRGLLDRTLVDRSDEGDDPRAELRLRPDAPGITIGGGRIAAILLPRRQGSTDIVFRKASAAEAAAATIPASTLQLPAFRAPLFTKLLATLNAAPRFVVDTGADPARIPAAFHRFLDGL